MRGQEIGAFVRAQSYDFKDEGTGRAVQGCTVWCTHEGGVSETATGLRLESYTGTLDVFKAIKEEGIKPGDQLTLDVELKPGQKKAKLHAFTS